MAVRIYLDSTGSVVTIDDGFNNSNQIRVVDFVFNKNDYTQEVTFKDKNNDYSLRTLSTEVKDQAGVSVGTYQDVVNLLISFIADSSNVSGVESVTGLNTDNTDPLNPVVKIGVDEVTITGTGTITDPLSVIPLPVSIGNYAQTVQGSTINTIGEQSIIGSGVGSLSIPANGFTVGDSFHGKIGGLINATGGGGRSEIIINIRSNGTVLATTGAFDLDVATNEGWEMELDFTIRSIGTTGIICTNGNFVYTKDNNRSVFGYIFQDSKTIDTTANNTLDVTVEWRVLNAGDDIYSANFVLYKVF